MIPRKLIMDIIPAKIAASGSIYNITFPNKLDAGIKAFIAVPNFNTLTTGINAAIIEIKAKIAHIFNLYFGLTNSEKTAPNNKVRIASNKCSIISPTI